MSLICEIEVTSPLAVDEAVKPVVPTPVLEIEIVELPIECVLALDGIEENCVASLVTRQEQADEIAEGELWHIETYVGRSVVAVLIVVV